MTADMLEDAVATYQGPLIGYANSILGNFESARDVVQDTFFRLSQQDTDRVSSGIKPWLYTVCRNRSLDLLRKQKRMRLGSEEEMMYLESGDPSPSEVHLQNELHKQVLLYMDRLTDNQREVIQLKFQSDLSYREIATITGLSESNVGFLIHAGLKRLRGWMVEFTTNR